MSTCSCTAGLLTREHPRRRYTPVDYPWGRAEPEPGPPSSQSASEAQLHVSAHMGGGGGKRGPQSGADCVLGARAAVVAEGVGRGVETRPLARAPKGTQKKSLDAAVA